MPTDKKVTKVRFITKERIGAPERQYSKYYQKKVPNPRVKIKEGVSCVIFSLGMENKTRKMKK